VTDHLDEVRALLPGVRLDAVETLGGGARSQVRRVHARFPDGTDSSVIVKQFLTAGEGWAREAAGLTILPPDAPAARLLAGGAAPPVVVTVDLGRGRTVADALLGDDPAAATEAVLLWAEAIARLHRGTLDRRAAFRAALDERAGDLPIADHAMPAGVDEAARLLETRCVELGVGIPSGAMAALRELPRTLAADGPSALSPSDACPDNNVRTPDGTLALIDFEGAQWRHVAWDLAYLTVPWPSCWCSWRMPGEVAERAIERYRSALEDVLPYVRTPAFRRDLGAAALGWALLSTTWFLPSALGADPPPEDPAKRTPTRRAMILHRLDGARRNETLPVLAELARRLRETLVGRWGEVPLSYAPAFESD
jgi:hypothetical protein